MPRPAGRPDRSTAIDLGQTSDVAGAERSNGDHPETGAHRPEDESHLQQAIEEREFTPHFQPIVSLDTGEVLAAEALVRWRPTATDTVPPSSFLGLAERTGLIRPLGRQMLDRSVELLKAWGDAAPPRVHLNFSPSEFRGDSSLAEELRRVAQSHDVHLGRLCVEVSEQQARTSPLKIRRLRELGVHVALDDFGSGYASYSVLGSLPVTDLKIDGSLVRSLDRRQRKRTVVKHLVDLGRDLGVRVVAEGVQTAAQARRLREAGCRVAQGFLFGRPRAPAEFEETLLSATPRRSNGSSG